jgi:transcriptional regulator with XRE-family HTH domain
VDDELRSIRERWGAKVRKRRQARGWSQQQLGDACVPSIDQTTISRIELGAAGTTDELRIAIARALDTTPATLFAWPRSA